VGLIEKRLQVPDTNEILPKDHASLVQYLKDLNDVLSRYSLKLSDVVNGGLNGDNLNVVQTDTIDDPDGTLASVTAQVKLIIDKLQELNIIP